MEVISRPFSLKEIGRFSRGEFEYTFAAHGVATGVSSQK